MKILLLPNLSLWVVPNNNFNDKSYLQIDFWTNNLALLQYFILLLELNIALTLF